MRRTPRIEPEALMESQVEVDGARVTLRRNLGPLALTQMMQASKTGEVRGLMVDDGIYYWDAFNATHDQIAKALGIPYSPENRVFVWRTDEGPVLVDTVKPVDSVVEPFARLMTSPNIYFQNSASKWVNGEQLAA